MNTPFFGPHLAGASALSLQLGASLGVVPRFASAHLETHNRASNGKYKSFTHLDDEKLFLEYNTRGVFAFIRAAEALLHILPLGISHPITYDLLNVAKRALDDMVINNEELFNTLDTERFFTMCGPTTNLITLADKNTEGLTQVISLASMPSIFY